MRALHRITGVVLTAAVASCGDDTEGPGDVDRGRFGAEVTGGVSQSLEGNALYVSAAEGFSLVLSDGTEGITFGRILPDKPGTGTFPIASAGDTDVPDDQFIAAGILDGSNLCEAGSGTLTITSSGAEIEGTFEIDVQCFIVGGGGGEVAEATITGAFNAIEAEEGDLE
jgi:hypothetical protein